MAQLDSLLASLDPKRKDAPFTSLELEGLEVPKADDKSPTERLSGSFAAWPRQPETACEDFALRPKQKSVTLVFKFGQFGMDWVHDGVFHRDGKPRWARITPDLEFALGVFCYETALFDAARKHFEAVMQDGKYGEAARLLRDAAEREGALLAEYRGYLVARQEERPSAELELMQRGLRGLADRHPGALLLLDILPADRPCPMDFHEQPAVPPPPK
jgi:hypothetical protein